MACGESVQKNCGGALPRKARSLQRMAVATHAYEAATHPTRKDTVCMLPAS
jgi:hypothetical protein